MARRIRDNARRKAPPPRRVTATVSAIGAGGDGIARLDGETFFVPLTAPGDRIVADVRGERGQLVEVVEPSADRAEPPCPHYGECGGCTLQHISAASYQRWKRDRIVDALRKAGLTDAPVAEPVMTPPGTRRRATLGYRRGVLGFKRRRSETLIGIPSCVILHPGIATRLPQLAKLIAALTDEAGDATVTLCSNGIDLAIATPNPTRELYRRLSDVINLANEAGVVRTTVNDETLFEGELPRIVIDGFTVTPPPGGFLQASAEGEAALIEIVREATQGARKIADLFCGCGTFALPLSRRAPVRAFDSDAASVGALQQASAAAQRGGKSSKPVIAERRNLFERPLQVGELSAFDCVVIDPPRAGARAQAEALSVSTVDRVISVSCNPSTFARDAAILSHGGYSLRAVTPVDQFVYASHIELVAVFDRGS